MQTSLCPSNQELEAFLLGLSAEDEADFVEEHLASCQECVNKLGLLNGEDFLIDLTRKQSGPTPRPQVNNRVRAIIDQLKALCSSSADVGETHAFLKDASTLHGIFEPPQGDDEIGRLGPYRIIRLVGSGGMGMVFQALDRDLNRSVAIKILRPSTAGDSSARERFLSEARAVASFEHEHIVPIFLIGEKQEIPYFVMPYLRGETLQARVNREGPLPESEVRRIGTEIARGLSAAHRRGLIHRDIKPANIWLEADTGRVKILDFGLVRMVQEDVRRTQLGLFVGTPLFMSPEQADGGDLDERCDLFSLGSVLYVMATSEVPFPGETILAVLHGVCNHTPAPIAMLNPAISPSLIQIIGKLHAKNPRDRLPSADEAAQLLEQTPDSQPRPATRKWLLAVAACLLLGSIGTIILSATFNQDVPPDGQTPSPSPKDGGHQVVRHEDGADPPEKAPTVYPAALFAFAERDTKVRGLGGKVRDLLYANLLSHPEIVLVEREDIQKLLQELELNLSGAVKPGDATRVGQLTGAKLQISGSVLEVDGKLHLVAQIVGTETTRMAGASVSGKEPLDELVANLANQIRAVIKEKAAHLSPPPLPARDRIAKLKAELAMAPRPSVILQIEERHIGGSTVDSAVTTELAKMCREAGFAVLDPERSVIGSADVLIKGSAVSETAARRGQLVSVKARVELQAIQQSSGKLVTADRQTAIVIDLTEQLAGKAALQEAAAVLAERFLPKVVGK